MISLHQNLFSDKDSYKLIDRLGIEDTGYDNMLTPEEAFIELIEEIRKNLKDEIGFEPNWTDVLVLLIDIVPRESDLSLELRKIKAADISDSEIRSQLKDIAENISLLTGYSNGLSELTLEEIYRSNI